MASDPVREYLSQKRYSPRVIEGGIPYLIDRWEATPDRIAQDLLSDRDEYLNEIDTRRILAEALAIADEAQRAALLPRLAEADRRFRSLVLTTDTCAWGALNAYRHGWTREHEWWYWTRPRHVNSWPEEPLLAVLERVVDADQVSTQADTQLTLSSLCLYGGAVVITVGMKSEDERVFAVVEEERIRDEAIRNQAAAAGRRIIRLGISRVYLALIVSDDVGTNYETSIRSHFSERSDPAKAWGSVGESIQLGVSYLVQPAIPSIAQQVRMTIAEVQIIGHGTPGTPGNRVLLTLPGPWEFAVSLQ